MLDNCALQPYNIYLSFSLVTERALIDKEAVMHRRTSRAETASPKIDEDKQL
ncbi:hypothetical protein DPMN_133782 [Dreissena polymorpha]|uniref:Uncharacterized protein n=1 Tax=Dreissena polymorpha TaxID=45954 RepID=A0A9D4FUA0_DREPO|nr:hypothetical protein DPMN_133782 [Dreissena polymorpha]